MSFRESSNKVLSLIRPVGRSKTGVTPLEDYEIVNDFKSDVEVYLCRTKLTDIKSDRCRHWALYFYFKDCSSYIVYDAADVGGKLTPSRTVYPGRPQSEQEEEYDLIGTVRISQASLHKAALANPLNNQSYCVGKSNCQIWASVLCNKLGIGKGLEDIPTYGDAVQTADLLAVVCAVCGLGAMVFQKLTTL